MINYVIELWRVEDGEGRVCVLTVQTLLIPIDPVQSKYWQIRMEVGNVLHCLPIEASFIFNAPLMWPRCEVDRLECLFETREELFKRWCFIGDGSE